MKPLEKAVQTVLTILTVALLVSAVFGQKLSIACCVMNKYKYINQYGQYIVTYITVKPGVNDACSPTCDWTWRPWPVSVGNGFPNKEIVEYGEDLWMVTVDPYVGHWGDWQHRSWRRPWWNPFGDVQCRDDDSGTSMQPEVIGDYDTGLDCQVEP